MSPPRRLAFLALGLAACAGGAVATCNSRPEAVNDSVEFFGRTISVDSPETHVAAIEYVVSRWN